MEEVQLSEEELRKAQDDFKVGKALGRLKLYQEYLLHCSISLPLTLYSSDGISTQRTISAGLLRLAGTSATSHAAAPVHLRLLPARHKHVLRPWDRHVP